MTNFIISTLVIMFHINYKVLLLTYKALNGLAPVYLTDPLSPFNPPHSLRSQNSGSTSKSTKGGRAFSHLAPKLWNSLPDIVRGSDSLPFKLKTLHFSQAFK